jgi:protein disulfide-isomerase
MKRFAWTLLASVAFWQATQAAEGNWLTDFAKATALAKQEKKLVLMDFTGSDWCPPCQALHKNVLTSKEFVDFAKENLVLVLVDFPQHRALPAEQQKANDALSRKFEIEGYPTVILLNPDGKPLSKQVGYSGESAKEFVATLQKFRKQG